jgi:hypothetical protein
MCTEDDNRVKTQEKLDLRAKREGFVANDENEWVRHRKRFVKIENKLCYFLRVSFKTVRLIQRLKLWTGGITVDNTQERIQTLLFQNVEEKNMEWRDSQARNCCRFQQWYRNCFWRQVGYGLSMVYHFHFYIKKNKYKVLAYNQRSPLIV